MQHLKLNDKNVIIFIVILSTKTTCQRHLVNVSHNFYDKLHKWIKSLFRCDGAFTEPC